jgi:hypothetical protein
MPFREITTVYSQNYTKHLNSLCGQNGEIFNVEAGGVYSNHYALNSQRKITLMGNDEDAWGSGRTPPRTLNLGTRLTLVVSSALQPISS